MIPSTGVMQLNSSITGFRKEKIPIELISFQQVLVLDEPLQLVTRQLSTPHGIRDRLLSCPLSRSSRVSLASVADRKLASTVQP